MFLGFEQKIKDSIEKHNIEKVVGFYMLFLEQQRIIILDAKMHMILKPCVSMSASHPQA